MSEGKFMSYLRVSTDKQGRSGLGIEAQREAVASYLNGGRCTLAAEYVETESGRRSDRPKLVAALSHAKAVETKLVFAKAMAAGASRTAHNFPLAARQDRLCSAMWAPRRQSRLRRCAPTRGHYWKRRGVAVESDFTPGVRLASRGRSALRRSTWRRPRRTARSRW